MAASQPPQDSTSDQPFTMACAFAVALASAVAMPTPPPLTLPCIAHLMLLDCTHTRQRKDAALYLTKNVAVRQQAAWHSGTFAVHRHPPTLHHDHHNARLHSTPGPRMRLLCTQQLQPQRVQQLAPPLTP